VALCAAHAAARLGEPGVQAAFTLDARTFKNGMGVTLPNTDGNKGNVLAGAIGVLLGNPEQGMELLQATTPEIVEKAKIMVGHGDVTLEVDPAQEEFYVRAVVEGEKNKSICIIAKSHTNIVYLEKNGEILLDKTLESVSAASREYAVELEKCSLGDLIRLAEEADDEDLAYIRKGVDMNLEASANGRGLKKVGFNLDRLLDRGDLSDDVFTSTKILAAYATDARMEGRPIPVMSSGESGNQGIVAILVPYNFGIRRDVPEGKILRSIALSHLLNAYVKIFTGELSPICGCAIAAGVGAAAAIVYQLAGADVPAMSLAINNLLADLGGMFCDGAKGGCALKVVSSVESAIRSAYMAVNQYGITETDGFVGKTAEETIRNLAQISTVGMGKVDPAIVEIMLHKQRQCESR
jgi:L-cysteine desulfidase